MTATDLTHRAERRDPAPLTDLLDLGDPADLFGPTDLPGLTDPTDLTDSTDPTDLTDLTDPTADDTETTMYALTPAIAELPDFDTEWSESVIRTSGPRCADGNGTLTELFFSDDLVDIGRAKAICARCPMRANCLADALAREEPWGVWGGELLVNGRVVANKRACGRPPKRPRPQLVIDEMGVVDSVA